MPGHYFIPALYNAAMKISVYECFITHARTHACTHARTHACTHAHTHTHTSLISYLYVHSNNEFIMMLY